MTSIVIPAYNEGRTITRCLETLLEHAQPGEFEIAVVANGCHDDTADRARAFSDRGVVVVETQVGNKTNALNLGDDAVSRFPRIYLDADILVDAQTLRLLAASLTEESEWVVAAPRAVIDYQSRPLPIRAFYHVWTRLPYFTAGIVGAGVYAFSERGRQRFDRFPDIIADDEFARLQAAPHERGNPKEGSFTITPPTRLSGLVDIQTRARAGLLELKERFPALQHNNASNSVGSLQVILRSPQLWMGAPIYLSVMAMAQYRAKEKIKKRLHKVWERDDSARVAFQQGT